MVTCCPLIDGHNYAFQVDYRAMGWLRRHAAAARHRDDIRISLEYKLNESSNTCILGDMTGAFGASASVPHVGVTMDVGHALIAMRRRGRQLPLGQDDLSTFTSMTMVASGIGTLLPDRSSCGIWSRCCSTSIGSTGMGGSPTTSPAGGDQVEEMAAAIAIVETGIRLLDKLGREKADICGGGIPARALPIHVLCPCSEQAVR